MFIYHIIQETTNFARIKKLWADNWEIPKIWVIICWKYEFSINFSLLLTLGYKHCYHEFSVSKCTKQILLTFDNVNGKVYTTLLKSECQSPFEFELITIFFDSPEVLNQQEIYSKMSLTECSDLCVYFVKTVLVLWRIC